MISPLLVVLECREGNHWVPVSPIHSGQWFNPIQWEWEIVGIIYKIFRVGVFPLIPPHWDHAYLLATSFIGEIYLALVFARKDMTLDPFWDTYHLKVWWLVLKTPVLQDIVKKYLIPFYLQKWSRCREPKWVHNPFWFTNTFKCSVVPRNDSHMLSVLLLNTTLQVPKNFNLLFINSLIVLLVRLK